MIGRILAIASNTFREAIRDKVLYNLVIFALLMTGAALLVSQISVDIERQFIVNMGLSAISVFGLAIALLVGITLVSKEIDKRTLYTVLAARPVARWEFLAGKWLGLIATLLVNALVMAAGLAIALWYESSHVISADTTSISIAAIVGAMYFIFLQFVLMTSVAMMFSTNSSPLMSSIFAASLFVIGSFAEDLRGFASMAHGAVGWLAAAVSWIAPNFSSLQIIPQAAHDIAPSMHQVLAQTLYVGCYSLAVMGLATIIFERRNLK